MYFAKLTKKERLFQPAYRIEEGIIYITDSQRAKKKFIKSGIKDVYFGEEFEHDDVMAGYITKIDAHDEDFMIEYLEDMIEYITVFLRKSLPYGEIGVYSSNKEIADICTKYARMVSVVSNLGSADLKDGASIRYVKSLKAVPDLVITDGKADLSPVFNVARINLGDSAEKSPLTLSRETMSFKTSLFPFDIGVGSLLYFIKKGEKVDYSLTSYRKKCPPLFTFS